MTELPALYGATRSLKTGRYPYTVAALTNACGAAWGAVWGQRGG